MTDLVYTVITFAPVQGFIEKSRKLRDLYGSSFILSYLAGAICDAAQDHLIDPTTPLKKPFPGYPVISPALIDQTQGTPNQLIIAGEFPKTVAKAAFDDAWGLIMQQCRAWVEREVTSEVGHPFDYCWRRDWSLWTSHAWEFFWATGATITAAREALNEQKRSRDWTGVNWQGESSTLSGADAIAHPGMSRKINPKQRNQRTETADIETFYQCLSLRMSEAMVNPREQLSIPELVKRIVTLDEITKCLPNVETPKSFRDLDRWKEQRFERSDLNEDLDRKETNRWTGWFQGDGDGAGKYLEKMASDPHQDEAQILNHFSRAMREWGETLDAELGQAGRIVYAGGDDFLGILYRNPPAPPLAPQECLDQFFYRFNSEIWNQPTQKPITVSIGFVWVAPNIPQREVLQHCREAERSAKTNGRDRLALRVLFNSGNYLEWVCPWRFLPVLQDYRDRNGRTDADANWTHLYNDVAVLEARHAFEGDQIDVAFGLLKIYFPNFVDPLRQADQWWNREIADKRVSGILGEEKNYETNGVLEDSKVHRALNDWIINLAKVGFHLCSNS